MAGKTRSMGLFVLYMLLILINGLMLYDFRHRIICRLGIACPVIEGEVLDKKFQRVQNMYQKLWANGTEQLGSQLVVYHRQRKVLDLFGKPSSGIPYNIQFFSAQSQSSITHPLATTNSECTEKLICSPGSTYSAESLQTIWSCSKVIESLVAAMCVERGKPCSYVLNYY